MPGTVAHAMLDLLAQLGVDTGVFADGDWRLRNTAGPSVVDHRPTVGFNSVTVIDIAGGLDRDYGFKGVVPVDPPHEM